ncbi:MAG: Stp1/IreP family PP2C-type Ser/Thr phosphatase [Acidimicrobiales bacterium]
MTVLRSGSASDVGRVRPVNQDLPLERPNLFAVADGMGGHVGGEVAARVAVEALEHAFERAPTVEGLREAFSEANAAVWHESQVNADLRGMGTTLTAVALVGGTGGKDLLALANVGDSRAYLFSGGDMTQVTADHSLAEERMRQGEMTEEEAAVHPQRHILTRALGVSAEVEADMWELELRTGDRLLLCSDGLTNEVGIEEIAGILGEVDDPGDAAQHLVDAANEHGGADNITVVVVDVQVGEEGDGVASKVTPLTLGAAALGAAAATAAVPVVGPPSDGEPADAGPGTAAGPSDPPDATAVVPAVGQDETLAPGSRLAFGGEPATLAETGPRSDEFFVGAATAVPVARSTARVPPPPRKRGSDKPEGKESRGARRRRLGIPRRITPRVIGFVILVAAVPVAAYYVLKWYAYDNWIVTSQGEQIVVKQGQPGGVLWFHPRVVDHTGFTTSQILPAAVGPLRAGVQQPSLHAAKRYVTSITTIPPTTTTTVATTTTTTLPARRIVVTPLPAPTTTTTVPITTTTTAPVTTTTAAAP